MDSTPNPPNTTDVDACNVFTPIPNRDKCNYLVNDVGEMADIPKQLCTPSLSDTPNSGSVNIMSSPVKSPKRFASTIATGVLNPPSSPSCSVSLRTLVPGINSPLDIVQHGSESNEAVGCDDAVVDDEEEPVKEPVVGMVFPTLLAVKDFYKLYGFSQGFGVIALRGSNDKNQVRRHSTFACECFGNPDQKYISNCRKKAKDMEGCNIEPKDLRNPNRRLSKKCFCTAMIRVSRNTADHWVVKKVVLEHKNHNPKPTDAKLVKEYRMKFFNSSVDKRMMNDYRAGVPFSKTRNSMALERGGFENMPFTEMDMRHRVLEERKLKMQGGDAKALVAYFDKMQAENVNFLHAHRLDEEGKMKDIIWVDARSKAAYKEFSDVICFDTTYLTNLYALPFANFVGVNHHGQTILLGCALISNEDCDTFEWVFRKWLMFMDGKQPGGILTDQAAAFRKPLEEVMPDAKHRWCIWHITNKLPHRLGNHERYDKLKEAFLDVVYNSLNDDIFCTSWAEFLVEYELEDNEWLAQIYAERHMWVPSYMTDHFWAGMRSTQRVESIHSFFDQFVTRDTMLCEFGERYTLAVNKRISDEKHADELSRKMKRALITGYSFEKFFHKIYTPNKFRELQRECERVTHSIIKEKTQIDSCTTKYYMQDRVWRLSKKSSEPYMVTKDRTHYSVVFNSDTLTAVCECKMFETNGIMCRHIIRVFDLLEVNDPPELYILRRWRKDLLREHTNIKIAHQLKRGAEVARRDITLNRFDSLVDLSEKSEARTKIVLKGLDRIQQEVEDQADREAEQANKDGCASLGESNVGGMATSVVGTQNDESYIVDEDLNSSSPAGGDMVDPVHQSIIDPDIPKKRGRPRTTRFKSALETGYKNVKKNTPAKKSNEEVLLTEPQVKRNGKKMGKKMIKNNSKNKGKGETKKGKSVGAAKDSVNKKGKKKSMSSKALKAKAKIKSVSEIIERSCGNQSKGTRASKRMAKRRKIDT